MAETTVTKSDLSKIVSAAMDAVQRVAAKPNAMSPTAIAENKPAIKTEMHEEVGAVIAHVTNNEPWYQSRVTLGSLLAVIAGIAGAFGYAFPEEMRGQIIELIIAAAPIVGGLLALYGRWVATKPLGS